MFFYIFFCITINIFVANLIFSVLVFVLCSLTFENTKMESEEGNGAITLFYVHWLLLVFLVRKLTGLKN